MNRSSARLVALCLLFGTPVPALSQQWVKKGPAPAFGEFNSRVENQDVSGAIEVVVPHPTNSNILWIGSTNGGVFRTNNARSASPTWVAQTDGFDSLSIGALDLDPTDSSSNTLVAGIGLMSSFGNIGGRRTGLLRTTNGGSSWSSLSSLASANVSGIASRGSTIVATVDSSDSGLACNTVGLARSTNAGASFSFISNTTGTGLPCGLSHALASDPTDSSRLFTAMTHGTTVGLYRSTNTGATWSKVSSSAMDNLLALQPPDLEIAVGRAGGSNANVFVAICRSQTNQQGVTQHFLGGLFYSGNAGNSWTQLDFPGSFEQGVGIGIHPGGQCNVHLSLAADPNNPTVAYIGGDRQPGQDESGFQVPPFPNSLGAVAYSGRLYRVNAAASPNTQATPITNCPSALSGCSGARRTVNNTGPHADSRAMAFDAGGQLLQGDDGGIYRHTDPNGTNGDWVSVIGDLTSTEQHSLAYDPVAEVFLSGNQDNGTTLQDSSATDDWSAIQAGDGGDVVIVPNDPVSGQSTRYFSSQSLGGLQRAVYDSGNNLLSAAQPARNPLGGSPALQPQFLTPLAANAVNPARLLVGANNGIYESFDRLNNVTLIASNVRTQSFNSGGTMAYGAQNNADALYVAADDRVYVRTAAPPASVVASDPNTSSTNPVLSVTIDPSNGSAAFAVDPFNVYRTTNGGSSWSNVTGNLFSANNVGILRSVLYVPGSPDRLAVGTERGVFTATETSGFSTWNELGSGLPHALVFTLIHEPSDDLLAAGTLGRGTWSLDLSGGAGSCAPDDAFEPDNSSGQASLIEDGDTQAHKICPAGDEDWVTFSFAASSSVTLETSGNSGDTRLTLYDSGLQQIDFDDDGGTDLFSRIERSCGSNPLAAGTYYARVDEFGNDEEIAGYDLSYSRSSCAGGSCPSLLTYSNTTISSPTSETAENFTLGPNLTIDAQGVTFTASGAIRFGNGVSISGTFTARNDPNACSS
ncbi:MAG: PPC domain-containing protein [Acidobacteriota bacterium]